MNECLLSEDKCRKPHCPVHCWHCKVEAYDWTGVPAADLRDILRNEAGICKKKGYPEGCRYAAIEEVKRRGLTILTELGWPSDYSAVYKNRYTADEVPLLAYLAEDALCMDMEDDFRTWSPEKILAFYEENKQRDEPITDELFGIIENWTPKELWTDEDCFDDYLPKNTLLGWGFS